MNYRLAIVTTDRPERYLHLTLASLLATGCTDPVDIYADARIPDSAWPLEHHDQFRFHRTSRRPQSTLANFAAALSASPTDQDLLILEDDVVFANGWQRVVDRIRQGLGGTEYLLSLYWCCERIPELTDLPIVSCPHNLFTCSQALLLQASYLPALRDHCQASRRREGDLTVGDFMTARSIPIYIAQPSLVQHWGKRSAAGSFYQQSPTFRGDAEENHR